MNSELVLALRKLIQTEMAWDHANQERERDGVLLDWGCTVLADATSVASEEFEAALAAVIDARLRVVLSMLSEAEPGETEGERSAQWLRMKQMPSRARDTAIKEVDKDKQSG